jgi:small GTP-binding protein
MQDVARSPSFFRVVTIGDSWVGKSSIVNRLSQTDFDPNEPPTVGSTFILHTEEVQHMRIQLQIWDTAGQERFRSLGPVYYRSAVAGILVFDLTNTESFHNLERWATTFLDVAGPKALIMVLGNKSDLAGEIVVTDDEAKGWANQRDYLYFSTSAKTGENIAEAIKTLAGEIVSKLACNADAHPRMPEAVLEKEGKNEEEKGCQC